MIENKYRVHEVAKDFGLTSKKITEILTEYATTPKNHMQVLADEELDIIFDYLTVNNQVDNLEQIFSAAAEKSKKEQAEQQGAAAEASEAENKKEEPQDKAEAEDKNAVKKDAANSAAKQPPESKQKNMPAAANNANHEHKGNVVHVIDTRGNGNVDLGKYDESIDALVPEKANKFEHGKQKITKKNIDKRQMASQKRRQEEQEKMKKLQMEAAKKKVQLKVMIPDEINVGELASRLKKTAAEVIKQLMKMGVMASISQMIDFDTAALVAMELGAKVEHEVHVSIEERLFDDTQDKEENLVRRSPVVVVMGHVDHGKTSLLDVIRNSDVVRGEAGGITQHIGAYRVSINGKDITFLDTPGHEAFTSMRARGAQITDVAILVVAADDGIMPQTIEAINHAKAANIPIVVAINKIDKEGANPDRIMQQLTEYGLVPEEWGGDVITCKVSAKKNIGIENLLEMVLLTAEMRDLKANPNRAAKGTVIEAKLDKGRGPVATVLVQNGTLHTGDIIIAGTSVGHVRAMTDDKGRKIDHAGPSVPVEIIGMSEVAGAGDLFHVVENERMARELVEQRKQKEKDERNAGNKLVTLENLFEHIKEGNIKELNIIVKADVQGSAEAVRSSLEKISTDEVRVKVIHSGVGAINESDVMLASASSAIIVGFNVRPDLSAAASAAAKNVDVRLYRVIYDCIEEMEAAMKGMLDPKYKEVVTGHAEIRQTFKVSGVGTIGGCYVKDGKIARNSKIRVVRDGVIVHEGELASLKRFKDDAKEVASGYECGISVDKFNDIKEGDIVEAYVMEEVKQ